MRRRHETEFKARLGRSVFRARARGEVEGLVNLHYGQDPGVKFYSHLSDQFGPFHTKVIAATANEAPYVLELMVEGRVRKAT